MIFHRDRPNAPLALSPHDDVRSIALSPDGKLVATGAQHGKLVRIWNADSGSLVRDLDLGSSRVAFSPDGRRLLTTGNGLELWSVDDGRKLWKGAGESLSALAFSPDGRLAAVDAGTGQILLYAADDGRIVARLADPYPTALHVIAFAPDGQSLVGISRDLFQVFAWNLESLMRNLSKSGLDAEMAIPRLAEAPAAAGRADARYPAP